MAEQTSMRQLEKPYNIQTYRMVKAIIQYISLSTTDQTEFQ